MQTISFYQNLEFNDQKIHTELLLETDFTKEIRILMKKNQEMKEHKTPFPIVVQIIEGEILFGIEKNKTFPIKKGEIISLSGGIPHHLKAVEDSIIRLTLSKLDSVQRVEKTTQIP